MKTVLRRRLSGAIVLALLVTGCASAPPNLSSAGVSAFNNTRVQKALDLLRDTVQDANAQTPPLISTATARTVTQWHRSAITIIHATGQGWQTTVRTSLDELLANLPANERALVAPYAALATTIINEVSK